MVSSESRLAGRLACGPSEARITEDVHQRRLGADPASLIDVTTARRFARSPSRWLANFIEMQDNKHYLAFGASDVDLQAKPIGNDIWSLSNLLGRTIGSIVQTSRGFTIEHDAAGPLAGISHEAFATMDAALSAIEKKIGGACRIVSG